MVFTVLALFAVPALAQDPGDAGIFFDPAGTQTSAAWPAFTTTNQFFAIAFDLVGDLFGYEFGLQIDPNLIVFASVPSGPAPINVGTAPLNWIVGTGGCVPGAGPVRMVTITAGFFVPTLTDALICMGPSSPSSFAPAAPGWLKCSGDLQAFGVATNGGGNYPDGCAVLYPSADAPVATDSATWTSVKAAY